MKKLLSLMLALVMLVSLVPTVFAADKSVKVNFSASDGATIIMKEKIAVKDGLAEKYGYEVATADHNGNEIDEATIFDAIVAAHINLYGEAFTPETAENYLVMTYSFITKAFGRETATLGFFANDRMPNDGIYNEGYGSYTGLACDTAEIKESDEIVFFFYQDQYSWGDYKADFAEDEINVKENEEITLSATAFSAWYGSATEETIAQCSVKAAGADIYSYDSEGQVEKIATLDANGEAKVSFDKAGEYTVFVAGNVTDTYGVSPLILDWATVTVEEVYKLGEDVTVSFSASDDSIIVPKGEIVVKDGLAEEYGYNVANKDHNGKKVEAPTVFDALVAVHKAYYGDAFTPETAKKYLSMSYSFISKSFEVSTSAVGFYVNDRLPNDGIYNEGYGSYTGYTCDTATLKDGDEITYFFYQDTKYWGDYKAEFAEDEFNVKENEEITLSVTAFSSWDGFATEEAIAQKSVKAAGADIYSYDSEGQVEKIATLDANGEATISFAEAGEYTLYVAGEITEGPVVIDWATVTVEEAEPETPDEPEVPEEPENPEEPANATVWQKILAFFKGIIEKIIACVVWTYNYIAELF